MKKLLTNIARFLGLISGPVQAKPIGEQPPNPKPSGGVHSSLSPYPVVWTYFTANGYPEQEAKKFYKRFQVISWDAGNIVPLTDWQRLADGWIYLSKHRPTRGDSKPPHNDTRA